MKKFLLLALCLICSFMLAACGASQPQTATVSFESDSAAGYEWSFEQKGEAFEITDEYVKSEESEADGVHTFTLTPVKEGESTVVIRCAKKSSDKTIREYKYDFEIGRNLQIKYKGGNATTEGDETSVPEIPQPVIE